MPIPVKAGAVFDNARVFLNDADGDVYSNDVLIPFLKIAYEDLRLEAEDANVPFTNKTSGVITVPKGVIAIGDNNVANSPSLPQDLIDIIEMYERTAGSTNDFMKMTPVRFLPKTNVQTTYLECYAWQGQTIQLLGATSNIEVRMDYVANTLNALVDKNSFIAINNCINAMSFRTAALVARYISEDKERSDELNEEAARCLALMENIDVKNQQSMPVRRRPFRSGFRNRNWYGTM